MRLKCLPARGRESILSTRARPEVGRRMFIISLIIVVFPAPFAPTSA